MNNQAQTFNFFKDIKNPRDAVINIIKTNNNPMVKNLVEMAEKGDTEGVENFARNFYKQQGRDFDKEFNDFSQFMKNIK